MYFLKDVTRLGSKSTKKRLTRKPEQNNSVFAVDSFNGSSDDFDFEAKKYDVIMTCWQVLPQNDHRTSGDFNVALLKTIW